MPSPPTTASVIDFHDQIRAYMEFMVRHFTINEALIFVHFEEFVRHVADREEYIECFDGADIIALLIARNGLRAKQTAAHSPGPEAEIV